MAKRQLTEPRKPPVEDVRERSLTCLFDATWYLEQYPDIEADAECALQHYLQIGAAEGRSPHPLFDAQWYTQQYSDARTSGLQPLDHYLAVGWARGYDPHPLFDTSWYLQRYPDVAKRGINPLIDYLTSGGAQRRNPNPDFDAAEYFRRNSELVATGTNPLTHFIKCGALPRRDPRRRRIQIFRRDGIGDVLLLTPVLKAFRAERPDQEIIVTTAFPELLEGNPYIDQVVRSRTPIEGCDETFMPEYETRPEEPIVERYARALGVVVTDRTPEIYLRNDERGVATELLREAGIRKFERFCVMQLTGGWAVKSWDVARFKAIAEYLEHRGFRVVVLGKDEQPHIDFGVDLRGQVSLRSVAAIIEKSALMVTIDSGLMHIGFAFRRPVVSLFGCTDPLKIVPDWAMEAALHADTVCRGCSHRLPALPSRPVPQRPTPLCPWDTVLCMEQLTVDMVTARIRTELERIEKPSVSIVLLHYNKYHLVEACLSSIFRQGARCSFEVIVVANGSPTENLEALQQWRPSIRILHLETNQTFAAAMNAGARTARGSYLLLLNDDTTVTAGWLDELVSFVESDPNIGIAGPKLLYPNNGLIQHCGTVVNENGLCEHLYKNLPSNLAAANRPRYFRTLTGACLLIDHDLFFRLGGFDLAYIKMGGCEDTDLCFKVIEQGKTPAYCPTSVVYHHEGVTRGVRDERHPEDLNNRRILAERWSHYLRPDMSDYLLLAEIEDEEGERWKRLEEIPRDLIAKYDTAERRQVGRYPFKVQFASGSALRPGYLHIDAAASSPKVNIVHDPVLPLPFLDGSVGEMYADGLVERIPWRTLPEVLREFHRVLMPGGRLQIVTTDLRAIAMRYLDEFRASPNSAIEGALSESRFPMDPAIEANKRLFGEANERADGRYACMDGDSLVALCSSVGFAEARWQIPDDAHAGHRIAVTALR